MNGRFFIDRRILQWEWWHNPLMVKAWVWLLGKVNWQDTKWNGITIRRGETILTYPIMCEALDITNQQARTIIGRLKTTGEITVKTTNKYSLLQVVNYDDYQIVTDKSTGKQQTKQGKRNSSIRSKSLNKDNKEPKNLYGNFIRLTEIEHKKLIDKMGQVKTDSMINRIDLYIGQTGKKYASHYFTALNWNARDEAENKTATLNMEGLFND